MSTLKLYICNTYFKLATLIFPNSLHIPLNFDLQSTRARETKEEAAKRIWKTNMADSGEQKSLEIKFLY